jgi:hypothetical protein
LNKDYIRDYATEAFRLYARMGQPTYDAARERIRQDAIRRSGFTDPQKIFECGEMAIAKHAAQLADILAVNETLRLLEARGKRYISRCIREVYFINPSAPLRSGDLSARVIRLSISVPAADRTIYRWLKQGRLLFAGLRGLRIDNIDTSSKNAHVG